VGHLGRQTGVCVQGSSSCFIATSKALSPPLVNKRHCFSSGGVMGEAVRLTLGVRMSRFPFM